MFKIKLLLYKDLILNLRGCRKSNQLLRHPLNEATDLSNFRDKTIVRLKRVLDFFFIYINNIMKMIYIIIGFSFLSYLSLII